MAPCSQSQICAAGGPRVAARARGPRAALAPARLAPVSRARPALGAARRAPAARAAAAAAAAAGAPAAAAAPARPSAAPRLGAVAAAAAVAAACVAASLALAPAASAAAAKAGAAAAAAAPLAGPLGAARAALGYLLHLDVHLGELVARHGVATYWALFGIVFAETGLVIAPFLPGDSLLFATGALAALGKLSLPVLLAGYGAAAIAGDAVNYAIGAAFGGRLASSGLLSPAHLAKTREFYARHGGKTVVLARFVPIVRTFAPFVAGVGSMAYAQFAAFNVAGAALWVGACTLAGYAFGNVPAVHDNFSLVVLGIIAVSCAPVAWELWAAAREARGGGGAAGVAARRAGGGGSLEARFRPT